MFDNFSPEIEISFIFINIASLCEKLLYDAVIGLNRRLDLCIRNTFTLKTLPEQDNINTSSLVRDFYDRMYTSNLMNLVVLSKDSLQDLINLIVPLMSQIPNKNIFLDEVPADPFGPRGHNKLIKFVPVKESHYVSILWTIPSTIKHYRATPFRVLSKLLQGSQKGSLLEHLQRIGWVESFSFYELLSVPGCSIAEASFSLSSIGIEHWEEVVHLMFQYFNLYRTGIENWRFQEYQKIFSTNFEYSEKITPWSYVSNIVDDLPLYNLEDCISGNQIMYEIRPDLVENIIDHLTPNNCSIFISSSTFANITDKTEHWYGTKYKEGSIPDELLQKWENCGVSSMFYKPNRNDFIPENFDIIPYNEADSSGPLPTLIIEDEFIRLWYKQDRDFNRPRAYVMLSILSTDRYWDKEIYVAYSIYWHLLNIELNRELAQARRCKYVIEVKSMIDSATVTFGGYNDKVDILCKTIVHNLFKLNFNEKEFAMAKDADIREYRNSKKQKQSRLAVMEFGYLMRRRRFTNEELLPFAKALTFDRFNELLDQIMRHIGIDVMVFGNILKEKSIEIARLIQATLQNLRPNSIPLSKADRHILKETHLPAGSAYVRTVENLAHPANAVFSRYQISPFTLPKYVHGMLFVEMFEEHFFDVLRTNEHLGYIAMLDFSSLKQSYFVSVLVQSDKNVNFVQSRIDALMNATGQSLRTMSDSEFRDHVESLESRMSEKPKNMYQQGLQWFEELNKMETIFDRKERIVKILKNITKGDVIRFYEDYLAPYAVERRKLTIYVKPAESVALGNYKEPSENEDTSIKINQTVSQSYQIFSDPIFVT
ncbi:hypothetical protein GJ496_002399 [Pomphorhynchus laevis]|nr:hypothetical protein GJ496_002399 [Pomphorhynchus laevis]